MGAIISLLVKDKERLPKSRPKYNSDEVPLGYINPYYRKPQAVHEWEDFGTTNVSTTTIGSPDTDFLIYKFEIQNLKEEIEKLTKELELVQKENEDLRKEIDVFQSRPVIRRRGKKYPPVV